MFYGHTRKVARDPWRWVGYAEITSSYEHSSHNSRSEVGNLWMAWCHPSGFQMWLRSMFYLRTSMIFRPLEPEVTTMKMRRLWSGRNNSLHQRENPIACAKERVRQRCYASQWRWLHMTIPTSMRVGLPITTANQGDALMSQIGHTSIRQREWWISAGRQTSWDLQSGEEEDDHQGSSECQISNRMLN